MRLGMLAEKYFADDPNTSLLKQRQFAELMTQLVASRVGTYKAWDENQFELLRRLQGEGILQRDVAELFHQIRKTGNDANHDLKGSHANALVSLKYCWQLAVWFHRTFKDRGYKSGPFIPPAPPKDESAEMRAEFDKMARELADYKAAQQKTAEVLQATSAQLEEIKGEKAFWEQMVLEADQAKAALQAQLAAQQAAAAAQPQAMINRIVSAASAAATEVALDEADTRKLIDEQLREAGWTVDSAALTLCEGRRPEKGKNLAIAEWPTGSGPADYVLFVGLTPVAVVEAKRKNIDVSASLQQAKRYSRAFIDGMGGETLPAGMALGRVPHPVRLLDQWPPLPAPARHQERHLVLRPAPARQPRPPARWLVHAGGPDRAAQARRRRAPTRNWRRSRSTTASPCAPTSRTPSSAVEAAIGKGQRAMLLAMATGTGKTKTCIALIYRLLKAQRFRRVLFLVDRSALGEQAANAFKDTRMESLQTFADIFGIKELDDQAPDTDTAVHIATVQGMVQRVLYPRRGQPRRRRSTSTTASSSTNATAATCSTASCPTPNSASAASTTTSPSTGACSTTSTR